MTANVERNMTLSPCVESSLSSNSTCRLCLCAELPSTPIFTEDESSKRLRICILDCCPVTLFKDDRLPKMVCRKCEEKVVAMYEFREQCRESERRLRSCYGWSYSNASRYTLYCKTVQDRCTQTDDLIHYRSTEISKNVIEKQVHKRKEEDSVVSHKNIKIKYSSRICQTKEKQKIEKSRIAEGESNINNTTVSNQIAPKARSVESERNKKEDEDEREMGQVDDCSVSRSKRTEYSKLRKEILMNKFVERIDSDSILPRIEKDAIVVKDDHRSSKSLPKSTSSEVEKRFLCDVCSKMFASKSGLRFHLKSHSGAKPYLCQHCGKGFAIPSYAKRHERIHAGDKRFVCHYCSTAFASPNGLKYHLRSHTGEANYRCETCGKAFHRYKYLKEHVFTHTGEKPFVCKICGSAYGNSGSLFVHEKKCKTRPRLGVIGSI